MDVAFAELGTFNSLFYITWDDSRMIPFYMFTYAISLLMGWFNHALISYKESQNGQPADNPGQKDY